MPSDCCYFVDKAAAAAAAPALYYFGSILHCPAVFTQILGQTRISAQIYGIYLHYVAPEDVHVYSIDECFIDCTAYLHAYREEAERQGTNPAHLMAITMIREVLKITGITATVGIGTNLYLAKVAMDIVAKKQPADKDGVRIAELNEDSYKFLLWEHKPLTDFWQIGPGKARRLQKACMFTMGDIAQHSQWDEEWFYKQFGIDGEILIDHALGHRTGHNEGHQVLSERRPQPFKRSGSSETIQISGSQTGFPGNDRSPMHGHVFQEFGDEGLLLVGVL